MSILVLATSVFLEAQMEALQRLAPNETIVSDVNAVAPDDVEVVVAFRLPPGFVDRFPRLRFVASPGAGVDEIVAGGRLPDTVPLTRPHDERQSARMAQYVTLAVLRWHRELPRYEAQQRERHWARHVPEPEETWPIGLMGYGGLGRAVASALAPLGYPLRAWTRTPRSESNIELFAGDDALDAFLASSRVVVCLLPLTERTRGLLDARRFAAMQKGAYVVNVSRGAIVVEDDLVDALDRGHLAGAALDVHATEPLPAQSRAWRHDRILVTPHIAAVPRPETAARQILDNLARARRGEPLQHRVDRARGY